MNYTIVSRGDDQVVEIIVGLVRFVIIDIAPIVFLILIYFTLRKILKHIKEYKK